MEQLLKNMKKVFLLLVLSIVSIGAFAYNYVSSDFSNQPYIPTKLQNYATKDAKILLYRLKGDTILLTYAPTFQSYKTDYRVEFELAQPDTVWIKYVKKPKLNKHYYLCLSFKGEKVDGVNYKDGSPFFKTPNMQDERFVIKQVIEAKDIAGRLCVELEHIESGRTIIWHIENKCSITDISLQNRINTELKASPIYVGTNNSYGPTLYYIVTSSKAMFTFDFSASVYSSLGSATTKMENNSKLYFVFKDNDAKTQMKYYYVAEGGKSYASYKFVTKEMGDKYFAEKEAKDAKAVQQAIVDDKMDSTFVFPVKLGEVHDEITDKYIDLGGRTGFVYGTTKGKIYGTDYLVYWHGVKLQLSSYLLDEADADKKAFLQRRGEKGIELREQIAMQKDKEQTEIDDAKAEAFTKKCKAKKAEFVNKQIFLIEHFFSTGEYHKCGVGVNIFNCFSKTIKYFEMTVNAYNTFNDPHKDEIGNTQKGARCIGPIAPKETGYYLFNELFWNENGVITNCRVTSVKITFTDNTSVSYSGWANVKKHYQEFFFDERNPDYME